MTGRGLSVRLWLLAAAMFFSICWVTTGHAQLDRTALQPGATANYRFAEPNEFPITVTLLGAVRNPGRYEISRKIDLINLIALAGGWLENADLSEVHISRLRELETQAERFDIKLDLDDVTNMAQTFVELQEGDCVYVGVSRGLSLPLLLSIVSATAAVATAVFYITQIKD
ncbi:MAG: SLBB domain-containing protein [Bacteroidetes bacterium]|nr:SLBB domain-containing protein [Bacteroidota bacterium]